MFLELCEQRGVADDEPGFQQRGLNRDVVGRLVLALAQCAHARSDLQANIPAVADKAFNPRFQTSVMLG